MRGGEAATFPHASSSAVSLCSKKDTLVSSAAAQRKRRFLGLRAATFMQWDGVPMVDSGRPAGTIAGTGARACPSERGVLQTARKKTHSLTGPGPAQDFLPTMHGPVFVAVSASQAQSTAVLPFPLWLVASCRYRGQ